MTADSFHSFMINGVRHNCYIDPRVKKNRKGHCVRYDPDNPGCVGFFHVTGHARVKEKDLLPFVHKEAA